MSLRPGRINDFHGLTFIYLLLLYMLYRHYSLLTDSITELMLRGQHESARHPFISLYEMQPETWPFIMQQSSSIISNGGINLQALKQIQPFIIYSLCYGSCDVQISLWNLLMGKLSITSSNQLTVVLEWMLESLLWQKKVGQNLVKNS